MDGERRKGEEEECRVEDACASFLLCLSLFFALSPGTSGGVAACGPRECPGVVRGEVDADVVMVRDERRGEGQQIEMQVDGPFFFSLRTRTCMSTPWSSWSGVVSSSSENCA
jgi:hypothetical protein